MFTDETHTWTRIRSENAMRHTEQVEIMSVKRRGRGSGEKKQNKNKRDRERERKRERERESEREEMEVKGKRQNEEKRTKEQQNMLCALCSCTQSSTPELPSARVSRSIHVIGLCGFNLNVPALMLWKLSAKLTPIMSVSKLCKTHLTTSCGKSPTD
jgi:hypothetical protein